MWLLASSTPGVGNVDPRGLVFWLGLELNSAGEWSSRINVPHPCSTQSSYIICTCSCIALTVVCRSHFVIQIDWSIMYNACMLLVKLLLVLTFSKYENISIFGNLEILARTCCMLTFKQQQQLLYYHITSWKTKTLMSPSYSSLRTCYPSTSTVFVQWNTTVRQTALQWSVSPRTSSWCRNTHFLQWCRMQLDGWVQDKPKLHAFNT